MDTSDKIKVFTWNELTKFDKIKKTLVEGKFLTFPHWETFQLDLNRSREPRASKTKMHSQYRNLSAFWKLIKASSHSIENQTQIGLPRKNVYFPIPLRFKFEQQKFLFYKWKNLKATPSSRWSRWNSWRSCTPHKSLQIHKTFQTTWFRQCCTCNRAPSEQPEKFFA